MEGDCPNYCLFVVNMSFFCTIMIFLIVVLEEFLPCSLLPTQVKTPDAINRVQEFYSAHKAKPSNAADPFWGVWNHLQSGKTTSSYVSILEM